jgi:hypothetical protein
MRYHVAAGFLLVLGLAQMAGDLLHLEALKGVAAVTNASPAPKVFSAVKGLETYSTRFFLEWSDRDGVEHSLPITPEVGARLRGPYNRRNTFGAVLAYGPVLATEPKTKPMFYAVAKYALTGNAPLLRELGIDPEQVQAGSVRIRLEPLPGTNIGELPRILEAPQP